VRKLAKSSGLTPSFIQNLRSGKQKDLKLSNLLSLSDNLGYELVLKNRANKEEISLANLANHPERTTKRRLNKHHQGSVREVVKSATQ
jgi:hypothetical protein